MSGTPERRSRERKRQSAPRLATRCAISDTLRMVPSFFFFLVIAVIVVALVAGRRYMQNVAASWSDAAAALGLSFDRPRFGRPRLSGVVDGMNVDVDVRVRKSGNSTQSFTRYQIRFPSGGFDFRLTRQTGLSRITQLFGAQDVEVGDATFDDAFVVKTSDEAQLRALLDGGARGALLRTAAAYSGVVFEDHGVFYEKRGLETSRDVIVSTVRRLTDAARAISGRRSFARSAEIVATRERGGLEEVADGLGDENDKGKTLDERLLELDTLVNAERRGEARERVRSLESEIPADPDLAGWKQRLDASGEAVPSARAGPDARAFAEEMFAGNALSFESKRIFDEKYRGASIRWVASVKSVSRVRERSNLGPEGATKLIATVARIDHDLYGNTDIDAVVVLPEGADAGLERDRRVTITGTLARVDPLVRNVFVTDAHLE